MSVSSWTAEAVQEKLASVPHWYHQIEVAPGIFTPGINASQLVLDTLALPEDCRGLRALDIGTRDGFFSFELERRGAEVLAIDCLPPEQTGFAVASELIGSKVPYVVANVYDLDPETHGRFDVVLFLGVIYHLRNPLLALDRVRAVCRDKMWIETQLLDNAFLLPGAGLQPLASVAPALADIPIMQFYPGKTLEGDPTNWWAPNMACLVALLEDAKFAVEEKRVLGRRGLARCRAVEEPTREYFNQLEGSAKRRA